MGMIETDVLLACINTRDRHHDEAVRLVESYAGQLALSPFSLLELDMLIRSGRVRIRDYGEFMTALSDFLALYGVEVLTDKPIIHSLAEELRARYSLTFFDSLHASAAVVYELVLYSYDVVYEKVKTLRWKRPSDALG